MTRIFSGILLATLLVACHNSSEGPPAEIAPALAESGAVETDPEEAADPDSCRGAVECPDDAQCVCDELGRLQDAIFSDGRSLFVYDDASQPIAVHFDEGDDGLPDMSWYFHYDSQGNRTRAEGSRLGDGVITNVCDVEQPCPSPWRDCHNVCRPI